MTDSDDAWLEYRRIAETDENLSTAELRKLDELFSRLRCHCGERATAIVIREKRIGPTCGPHAFD